MSFKSTILRFLKGIAVEEAEHLKKAAEDAVRAGAFALAQQELDKYKVNHGVLINDLNALIDDLKSKNDTMTADKDWCNEEIEQYQNKIEKLEAAVKKADEIAVKALQSLRERHPVLTVHTTKHQDKAGRVYYTADVFSNGEPAHISKGRISLKDINTMAERLGAEVVEVDK